MEQNLTQKGMNFLVNKCPTLTNKLLSYCLFYFRSSNQKFSIIKGVIKNFLKFTRKHLCQGLFFNKVAGLTPPDHCSFYFKLGRIAVYLQSNHEWMAEILISCAPWPPSGQEKPGKIIQKKILLAEWISGKENFYFCSLVASLPLL